MHSNIVSLNKRFGRHCFKLQTEIKRENVISNQPTEKSNFNFRHKTSHLDLTKLGRPVCENRNSFIRTMRLKKPLSLSHII